MAKTKKRSEPAAREAADASTSVSTADDTRDRIAMRAYELYLARGGSHGGDFDDWIAAERELRRANAQAQPGPRTETQTETQTETGSDRSN